MSMFANDAEDDKFDSFSNGDDKISACFCLPACAA